jgi:hypothetical protein
MQRMASGNMQVKLLLIRCGDQHPYHSKGGRVNIVNEIFILKTSEFRNGRLSIGARNERL